jgi:ABC-2 type transport system permease protein
MVVFKREFMRNLPGLVIWDACIAGLTFLMVGQYRESAEALGTASYPEAFVKAMGMDRVDMATPLGYYAGKASVVVMLFGSIYAALLGGGAIVRDESLLARPVSRVSVAAERLLAAAANLMILNLAIAGILLACGAGSAVWAVTAAQALLHLCFAAAGFAVAVFRIKARAALALPLGIVLIGYVLSMLYGMADGLDFVKYLTPFYYTDLKDILAEGGLSALHIAVVSAIIIAMASLGTAVYHRKDMPV